MFWDKGYMPSQNIEALLEKENATVEEFLDDDDILQECKSLKKPIVQYFTRSDVIKRLVELITTEPSEELPVVQRFRHANMASEILTLGLPSLCEKLLSDADTLNALYSYLKNEPPLNPLLSSFFSKTFCMLFTKKAEQDWFLYQKMCLEFLEYIKSQNDFLDLVCKHFATPIIPDLVMHMMKDVEGGQLKRNLYEWLTQEKLVERLIAILADPLESSKHYCVAEFLCDLIQQGRTMRQTEQEIDSFEPAFEGSNPILKTIENETTIEALLNVILEPNALDSAIISGISVVLTLIKPVVFVDEPNSDRMKFIHNREKEIHTEILATVIRVIAPRLKDFNQILSLPPNKTEIVTTAATLSPPFGKTRLQICKLFTVLLQTHNEDISKAICETDFFETLLLLFKQYCWNNFLHSEVEKCVQTIFQPNATNGCSNNTSTQDSTGVIGNDGAKPVGSGDELGKKPSYFDIIFKSVEDSQMDDVPTNVSGAGDDANKSDMTTEIDKSEHEHDVDSNVPALVTQTEKPLDCETAIEAKEINISASTESQNVDNAAIEIEAKIEAKADAETENAADQTFVVCCKIENEIGPSALQTHVVTNCKMISKFIDCWQHNKTAETAEKGRRLGYMGHLIKIFKHITNAISESEHIRALIENYLVEVSEQDSWQSITNSNDGEFTKTLAMQNKMLADCNAHEAGFYSQQSQKEYYTESSTWEYIMSSNLLNNLGELEDPGSNDIEDLNLFQYGRDLDDEDNFDDDNDENNRVFNSNAIGDIGEKNGSRPIDVNPISKFNRLTVAANDDCWDPFGDRTTATTALADNNSSTSPWGNSLETGNAVNFADFESHFSSFASDLGGSFSVAATEGKKQQEDAEQKLVNTEAGYDNNANVEKMLPVLLSTKTAATAVDEQQLNDAPTTQMSTTPLKRNFHIMLDENSDDDYDDDDTEDEGVWTKPLGGSSSANDDLQQTSEATITNDLVVSNGPGSNAQNILSNSNTTTESNTTNKTKINNKIAELTDVSHEHDKHYDDANDVDTIVNTKQLQLTAVVDDATQLKKLTLDENTTLAAAETTTSSI